MDKQILNATSRISNEALNTASGTLTLPEGRSFEIEQPGSEFQDVYEPLPDRLRYNGFKYEKVKRIGDLAMFRQHVSKDVERYEVFIVRKQRAETRIIDGTEYQFQAKEMMPKNSDFGETAWSCWNRERAEERFDEVMNDFTR